MTEHTISDASLLSGWRKSSYSGSDPDNCVEVIIPDATTLDGWRKSSHSNNEGGSCIEVLDGHPAGVPVRDSKDPHGPALVFDASAWTSFVAAVKRGEF